MNAEDRAMFDRITEELKAEYPVKTEWKPGMSRREVIFENGLTLILDTSTGEPKIGFIGTDQMPFTLGVRFSGQYGLPVAAYAEGAMWLG